MPVSMGVTPDSGGFNLVSGFAFFVEVATVDVVHDREEKILHVRISQCDPSGSRSTRLKPRVTYSFITPLAPLILRRRSGTCLKRGIVCHPVALQVS
jgi:hypothetical protein